MRFRKPIFEWVCGASLLAVVGGCAMFRGKPALDYRTVLNSPNHNTEKACEENQRALKCLEKGQLDKAEKALQQSLVADVNYGPAHNNLGQLYFVQKKYYLAAWEFESATKLMPEQPEPHNNLGLVFEAVGKLEDAIHAYETAWQLQRDNPQFIGNLARAKVRHGDLDAETRRLLENLVFVDTRPDWVTWAKEQLALGKLPSTESTPGTVAPPETTPAPGTIPVPGMAPMTGMAPTTGTLPVPEPIPAPAPIGAPPALGLEPPRAAVGSGGPEGAAYIESGLPPAGPMPPVGMGGQPYSNGTIQPPLPTTPPAE